MAKGVRVMTNDEAMRAVRIWQACSRTDEFITRCHNEIRPGIWAHRNSAVNWGIQMRKAGVPLIKFTRGRVAQAKYNHAALTDVAIQALNAES